MSDLTTTLNFNTWVDEHGPNLKPPVANKEMFPGHEDFIVMVVGGPNQRTDFHVDPYEEVFYQVRGNMHVDLITAEGPQEEGGAEEGRHPRGRDVGATAQSAAFPPATRGRIHRPRL